MTSYTIERNARQVHFILHGDLTASVVPELRTGLLEELKQGAEEVVFDLRHTVMLDSSGIGILIAAHNSLTKKQGKIQVIQVSPEIFAMLQSMRLVQRLHVSSSEKVEAHHG